MAVVTPSRTGVAEATAMPIQEAAEVVQRFYIAEERHDDSMITIEDDDEPDDEVAVAKDVADANSRIALLQKVLETFWANMDIDTWNGDYDHAAIEGAAELQQEEPVMDGRMADKNHHRQNLRGLAGLISK